MAPGKTDLYVKVNRRFKWTTVVIIVVFCTVVLDMLSIVIFKGDEYSDAAKEQSTPVSTEITAKRGNIIDRNNILLASSTVEYNLILDPEVILSEDGRYLDATAALGEESLGVPAEEIREKAYANPESNYVILRKKLTYSDVKDFKARLETEKILPAYGLRKITKGIILMGRLPVPLSDLWKTEPEVTA